MCITSGFCRKLSFQCGNSQNMLCFIQLCLIPYPGSLEGGASVTLGNWETLSQIWYPVRSEGAGSFSILFFQNAFFIFLNSWCIGKNWQWESNHEFFLPCFKVNVLLFSMQRGQASFAAGIQLDNILCAGKSLIVHIKEARIRKFYLVDIS